MITLDESLLALGSCIAGVGILTAGLLALLFRHPKAPRWTRPEAVALLVCVPVTGTIGFGLGYTIYGLSRIVNGAGDPRELLVPAAVFIVLTLLWRGLRIRQRLKEYAVATGHGAPSGLLEARSSTAAAPSPASDPAGQGPRRQGCRGLWHEPA